MDIILNFLPEDLLDRILDELVETPTYSSNLTSWPHDLIRGSGAILLYEITGDLLADIKAEILSRMPGLEVHADLNWNMMLHVGTTMSFIPWHNDETHVHTLTLYLNKIWEPNHAGYFLFKAEDNMLIQAVLPQYNMCLSYVPPIMHSVVMSSLDAPKRISLQVFIDKENADASE
jgi:hypothetical protein